MQARKKWNLRFKVLGMVQPITTGKTGLRSGKPEDQGLFIVSAVLEKKFQDDSDNDRHGTVKFF